MIKLVNIGIEVNENQDKSLDASLNKAILIHKKVGLLG